MGQQAPQFSMAQEAGTGKLPGFCGIASDEVFRMQSVRGWFWCGLTAGVLLVPVLLRGQSGRNSVSDPSVMGTTGGRGGTSANDMDLGPESAQLRIRRENARKTQRMERMAASANRLVELTKEFQAEFAAHPVMTADAEKRLDEIAKMAHDVRSRMVE